MSVISEHPFRKLYGTDFDFVGYRGEPKKTYFLSAIPRVGSTWFSLQLWRTGLLGAPLEYLNLIDRDQDVERFGRGDIHAYWRSVRRRRTSPNGVFGSKLFTRDIREVFDRQQDALSLIQADCLIHLRRRDHVEQAVSYGRAMQSRVWIDGGRNGPAVEPRYDLKLLTTCVQLIESQEASWQAISERTEARALTLYYEDYSKDPQTAIRQVKNFLEVRDSAAPIVRIPDIPKQRDATSREWALRLRADLLTGTKNSTNFKPEGEDHATVET